MTGLAPTGETNVLTPLTTGVYVSLHTADPVPASGPYGGSEVSGGSYARQSAAFTNSGSNPTTASNNAIITYPAATAAWGTVSHFGIWSAASGGNILGAGALTVPKTVNMGDTTRFAAGALTITVT